jgi:protein-L-isoaspartate(D-aspartate) O-methyltransferase
MLGSSPDARTAMETTPEMTGAEETVAFLMKLRAKGIRDTRILRAMETGARDLFAPRRFADLSRSDVSLPLPCGQTMTAPGAIATMLVALGVEPHHRVLEVGSGSGYVTAVLGRLAREVLSVERFRTLAMSAAERIAALGLQHVRIATGDGLAIGPELGPFDRILLNGSVDEAPAGLVASLGVGGRLVGATTGGEGARLLVIDKTSEGALTQVRPDPLRLPPLVAGAARAL